MLFSRSIMSDSLRPHGLQHRVLSFTFSRSLLKRMSIESEMPSNHLILSHPLLFLPSIFPSVRVFSRSSLHQVAKVLELQLQHQSFQWIFRVDFLCFQVKPGLTGLISLLSKELSRVFSSTTVWKHQFFSAQPFLWSKSYIHTWLLEKPYLWLYGLFSTKWCHCFLIRCLGLSQVFFQGARVF